jgi:Tripartite tricarboxylate transporter TctB family
VVAHVDSGITLNAQKVSAHVNDLGVTDDVARWRSISFFVWMAALIGLVALIGFIPAIAVFVFAYMSFGFGEPKLNSLGYALGTTLLCWVVFQWGLQVAWPQSLLGDLFPALREYTRLI